MLVLSNAQPSKRGLPIYFRYMEEPYGLPIYFRYVEEPYSLPIYYRYVEEPTQSPGFSADK